MMNRKSIIGAIVGVLLLTGMIGANLVMAGGRQDTGRSVKVQQEAAGDDNLECPAQGLPACAGQMNDDKNEGPENEANEANESEANEGPENEGPENEANEANENEANEANENDNHEDAEGADHQCPPDCDTANGEKP
ncbi:hypothetical protein BH24ACT26_BH24ACT26_09040 [soil metagenome]